MNVIESYTTGNRNFIDADLSGTDLSGANLSGAILSGADLSGAILNRAILSGAILSGADLSGADLSGAILNCANLNDADLSDANLSGADLSNAKLSDTDLSGADLSNANFCTAHLSCANLSGAKIENTIFDLGNVPCIANIHQKLFEVVNPSNFDMEQWHNHNIGCGTTHCRAGWIVILSGEEGKALEDKLETNVAAALIYIKSDPTLKQIPNWFASNEQALDDIKKMAMA